MLRPVFVTEGSPCHCRMVNIGIILLCHTPKIEIMCNLHKFVKCCKKMEKHLSKLST